MVRLDSIARGDPCAARGWGRHGGVPVALAAVALASACASAGPPAPPAPPPFEAVRSVILVREVPRDRERDERRRRDPLDALEESLRAKGIASRVVEVGPGLREDLRDVERLVRTIEFRAGSAPPPAYGRRAAESLGGDVRPLLERLGADAFAVYVRLDDRFGPRAGPSPPPGGVLGPPGPYTPGGPGARSRPLAAIALVDRAGTLLTLDWGESEPGLEPESSRLVNAAEAVEVAVRILAGEPEPEPL
jgi:hypothetical protein